MSRHNRTWVIRYQKKHSPTHTSEEEEGFAQTAKFIACGHPLCGALSQQGLLDPITPAYNQSQPDGQLKLTVSAFNGLWISMPAVLVTVSTVTQNSLQPLSASSIIAGHFLDFVAQGKITEADAPTTRLDTTHPDFGVPHLHHPPISILYIRFCCNPPNLSWLGTGTKYC